MINKTFYDYHKPTHAYVFFLIMIYAGILMLLLWCFLAKMDETVKADAQLRPIISVSSLPILYTGKVLTKMYENGQMVFVGDLLLQIDTTYEKKQLEHVLYLKEKYKADSDGLSILLHALETEIDYIENLIPWIKTRFEIYISESKRLQNLVDIAKTRYDRNAKIPAGLISTQTLDELDSAYKQSLYVFDSWRSTLITQLREEVRDLLDKQREIELTRLQLERYIKDSALYAPISGKIDEIKAVNIDDSIIAGYPSILAPLKKEKATK